MNENEIALVKSVLNTLFSGFSHKELNCYFGSITIEQMRKLSEKLNHAEYCKRHGIRFEDMTESDYEAAYFEKYEA